MQRPVIFLAINPDLEVAITPQNPFYSLLKNIYPFFVAFHSFFFLEFQRMAFISDNNSIITPKHQSVFGVGGDRTLNLLFNH